MAVVSLVIAAGLPGAAAGLEAPPEPGQVFAEDPLRAPGMLLSGRCASGKGAIELGEEGTRFAIRSKCAPTSADVLIQIRAFNLTVPDGEIRSR